MKSKEEALYLPGLNGIRAIASLIVLFFHIDQYLGLFGLAELGFHKSGMAHYAVVMFFVLSGYLITKLLIVEKESFKKISFRKFYMRRVLRIWPIYYLAILITLVLVFIGVDNIKYPAELDTSLFLYAFFLPNVAYGVKLAITTITPLWSVGVEEQFYSFWPVIISKAKNILVALLVVIFFYLLVKVGLRFSGNNQLYYIWLNTAFDCMAIGGIGALAVKEGYKILSFIYHPIVQVFAWAVLVLSVLIKPLHVFSLIDVEIHAVIYLIIIINVSTNKNTLIRLENRLFNYIGKISYGLYVYHMLIVCLLGYFLKSFVAALSSPFAYIFVFTAVIACTILSAHISYNLFEKRFLRLKERYSSVKSTNAKELKHA